VTIAVLLMLALASTATEPPQRPMQTMPGDDGLRYAIAVPKDYDGSSAVPLVLALHFGWGRGSPPPDYSAAFLRVLVEPALGDLGAIIVAPLSPGGVWTDPETDAKVMALLDHVKHQYRIDEDRVIVTGFSLGGMGTWYFASRHADILSAAIPMASAPMISEGSGSASRVLRFRSGGSVRWPPAMLKLPTYVIHSRDDELIAIGPVEAASAELAKLGADIQFHAIEAGIGHHETARYVPYLARAVPWIREVWSRR